MGEIERFKTIRRSIAACFVINLAEHHHDEMREYGEPFAWAFFIAFLLVFKFLLLNMFLGIIHKNYVDSQEIENEASKLRPAAAGALQLITGLWQPAPTKDSEIQAPTTEGENGDNGNEGGALEKQGSKGFDPAVESSTAEEDDTHHNPCEGRVNHPNWDILPVSMQKWAEHEADLLYKDISMFSQKRKMMALEELNEDKLEEMQKVAEEFFERKLEDLKENTALLHDDLVKGNLKKLNAVHQDQESLAWYIIQREGELNRLSVAKKAKQQAYENMEKCTRSLVETEDHGQNGQSNGDGWLFASVVVACLPTGFSLVLDPRERALQGARVLTSDDDEPRSDGALLLRFSVDHTQ